MYDVCARVDVGSTRKCACWGKEKAWAKQPTAAGVDTSVHGNRASVARHWLHRCCKLSRSVARVCTFPFARIRLLFEEVVVRLQHVSCIADGAGCTPQVFMRPRRL